MIQPFFMSFFQWAKSRLKFLIDGAPDYIRFGEEEAEEAEHSGFQ